MLDIFLTGYQFLRGAIKYLAFSQVEPRAELTINFAAIKCLDDCELNKCSQTEEIIEYSETNLDFKTV